MYICICLYIHTIFLSEISRTAKHTSKCHVFPKYCCVEAYSSVHVHVLYMSYTTCHTCTCTCIYTCTLYIHVHVLVHCIHVYVHAMYMCLPAVESVAIAMSSALLIAWTNFIGSVSPVVCVREREVRRSGAKKTTSE